MNNEGLVKFIVLLVFGIVLGGFAYSLVPKSTDTPLSGSGLDPQSLVEFYGGFQVTDNYATTTAASATLSARETAGFSSVAIYPSVGDVTLTTAASTTLGALLGPGVGVIKRTCFYNATTTAGIDITIAAGVGVDLEVASTTDNVVGTPSLIIGPDNSGCIEYQKKNSSSSTAANRNDITARFTRFINGD